MQGRTLGPSFWELSRQLHEALCRFIKFMKRGLKPRAPRGTDPKRLDEVLTMSQCVGSARFESTPKLLANEVEIRDEAPSVVELVTDRDQTPRLAFVRDSGQVSGFSQMPIFLVKGIFHEGIGVLLHDICHAFAKSLPNLLEYRLSTRVLGGIVEQACDRLIFVAPKLQHQTAYLK